MNQSHIMLDLETLGRDPGYVVLSIAAVEFNMTTGAILSEFYTGINLKDSLDCGFKIEAATLNWWLQTNPELLAKQTSSKASIFDALNQFTMYMDNRDIGEGAIVWGNSNRFDMGLLAAYYKYFDKDFPWRFRNEKDVRTLVGFAPEIKENTEFKGTQHNPIDDCKHQITYCVEIWNKIKVE